jgi:UDP-N-acetyl-D-galactosamine dehydrogenase
MGLTFKEDCPDLRNTKVIDIISELSEYGIEVDVFDPLVNVEAAKREYGISPVVTIENNTYDAILIAVAHRQFKEMGAPAVRALGKSNHVLYDLKYVLKADEVDIRL